MRTLLVSVLPLLALVVPACAPAGEESGAANEAVTVSAPSIAFRGDGSIAHDAAIPVGSPVVVTYDVHRLATCGVLTPGASDVTLELFYLTKSGHTHVALGTDWADADHGIARATLGPFPSADAGELQLWVHAANGSGCNAWDSANGNNYRFELRGETAAYSQIAPILHHVCGGCHNQQFDSLDKVKAQKGSMLQMISGGAMPRGNPGWKDSTDGRTVLDFLSRGPELE